MPRRGQCPECGADLSDTVRQAIRAALSEWLDAGLLDRAQYDRLQSTVEEPSGGRTRAAPSGWFGWRRAVTPGLVLLTVGGVFVVSAVAMVMADVWASVGAAGRIAFVWAPTVALYALGEALIRREGRGRPAPLALIFFAAILTPFALGVLINEAPMPFDLCCNFFGHGRREAGHTVFVAGLSLAFHVAALIRTRSSLLTVPACGSFVFLLPSATEWMLPHQGSGRLVALAILLAGILLLSAGQWARRAAADAFAVVPEVAGSVVTLMATTILGAEGRGAWELLAGAAPLAMTAAGCAPSRARYLPAGLLFLVVNIFRIGLQYFRSSIGLPVTLMLCGLAAMSAGYAVQRVRRGRG
jgi:hypothetical protein